MPTLKSLNEAATLCGVSRRLLQKWVSQGKLTAYEIAGDRKRYVDVEAVQRLRKPQALPRPDGSSAGEGAPGPREGAPGGT